MPRAFKILYFIALVIFFFGSLFLVVMLRRGGAVTETIEYEENWSPGDDPTVPDPGLESLSIPDFSLFDQEGRPVDQSALAGRITVANFIFTHCPLICPVMTDRMDNLVDALRGEGAQFLSFSVDPAHDTPAALKAFADTYEPDYTRWRFLTENPGAAAATSELKQVESIVRALNFALVPDPTIEIPIRNGSGDKMQNIVHPPWFVLIGRNGQILGLYSPDDAEEMKTLEARIRRLAAPAK